MSGSLLRKITQGLSPYHNPEGLTFGKNKLLEKKEPRAGKRDATHTSRRTGATVPEKLDIRAPADSQAYVEHISNRLANEFKWEIEHVEEVDPALRMQARKGSKPRVAAPGAEQGRRRKSKARLTEQRVEALVSESQATETGMYTRTIEA
ncbi:LAFE_0D01332g1_1 [Lachancea fermentati]|uniref:LAFE_0D01332g1_1 n=1 Tax=Lachancea fermentati TaxID=4955 RepID=A0A1G4MAV4_LACFM|nr:LAFE_0D01332g1_1 [Lachancea fermentati]